MIVTSHEEVQKYLPSYALKVKVDRIKDFLDRAQQWVSDCIIGPDIEAILEIDIAEGAPDPHERLRTFTSRAICELAYITMVAEMDLQLSEAGFVVQNNDNMSPASQQRTEKLVQSLHSRLCSDCDNLVKLLLTDSAYDDWKITDQFNYLTNNFMPTTIVARMYAPSSMQMTKWHEFYELQPKMSESLRGPVANYVSNDQIEALLLLYRMEGLNENQKKVLRWIRMATLGHVTGSPNADHFAIEARQWMLKHETDFPEFVASDRYELPKPFDAGDGTVANFL